MDDFFDIITRFIMIILLIMIIAFLAGAPTMWLWNYLMPYLFDLPKINFWQAICINMLCGILFGSGIKTSSN